MLIVSFDIGIINLGCSVLYDNKLIVWKVIKLFDKLPGLPALHGRHGQIIIFRRRKN